jgi:hypothetical protein
MKHTHYDLILLWAAGAEIQYQSETGDDNSWISAMTPQWTHDKNYRVKPQNKVRRYGVKDSDKSTLFYANSSWPNLELTFSPEGKLLTAKVL